jgi:hypothetical protein
VRGGIAATHNTDILQFNWDYYITDQNIFFARGKYQDLQIDFLLTKNPLFAHVQRAYTVNQPFFERTIPSATVEGLVLLKLYALPSLYRQGDFSRVGIYENDVATLMFYHKPNMAKLVEELKLFVSEQELAAIEDIIRDLEQRLKRFGDQPEPKRKSR